MLFGEDSIKDLPEEVVEILIENGVQQAQWAKLSEQIKVRETFGQRNSAANKFNRIARGLGLTGSAIATLWHTWYSLESKKVTGKKRLGEPLPEENQRFTSFHKGNPRGESFPNLSYGTNYVGSDRTI